MNTTLYPKWSAKAIVIGKPLTLLSVTVAVFTLLNYLSGYILPPVLEAIFGDENAYYFSIWVSLFALLVVALFVSVKILVLAENKRLTSMAISKALQYYNRERKFKWHILYALSAGSLVFYIGMLILDHLMIRFLNPENAGASYIVMVLAVIAAFVLLIIGVCRGTIWLHSFMIRLTHTNEDLINDMHAGAYNRIIPSFVVITEVENVLSKAYTHSVLIAVVICVVKTVLNGLWQLVRPIAKALGIVALFGFLFAVITGLDMADRVERELADVGKNAFTSSDDSMNHEEYYEKQQDTKQKWHNAAKAKEKWQYDSYQARKASAYNANSYDAQRKKEFAKQSYLDWKKAEKDKYN